MNTRHLKRNFTAHLFIIVLTVSVFCCAAARPDETPVGLVSFDNIIAPSSGTPGVNAFDIYNLTGPVWGSFAGDTFVTDSLTLQNAQFILTFDTGTVTTIDLGTIAGDIGPGEVLDPSTGYPYLAVQFSTDQDFVSAVFTATLSETTLPLFQQSTSTSSSFNALEVISATLELSPGETALQPGDFVVVNAESAPVTTGLPEASSGLLLGITLFAIFCKSQFLRGKNAWRKRSADL